MDWDLAIQRNRDALLSVVASIVALVGRDGGPIARGLRSAALALLRPAEAAARRLIVIAARGLVLAPGPRRPLASLPGRASADAGRVRPPAFRLFDRPKRYALVLPRAEPRGVPRIRTFFAAAALVPSAPPWAQPIASPPPPPALRPDPDAPVESGVLRLRLAALEYALADIPRQARRLARLTARRSGGVRPCAPLRFGRPPGFRAKPTRAVDLVLRECHALALDALQSPRPIPDSS